MMEPVIAAHGIARIYKSRRGLFGKETDIHALNGVSLAIGKGETLGIVGESGSGKSTMGRIVLGAEKPDSGSVFFKGLMMAAVGTPQWRAERAALQMIYQDPLGALDRRLAIATQVQEPLDIHGLHPASARHERVMAMLARVGLSPAFAGRYPHELSGGQRQRVVLARALMSEPEFLVCDEPVSALDVSIQAQVVNLLAELQGSLGLTMLFISHDLRVVRQISNRVAVMYLGEIVEEGPADTVFHEPQHPYTQALVSAAPVVRANSKRPRIRLVGEPPNPASRPGGCAFHPRCPVAMPRCSTEAPRLVDIGGGCRAACHLVTSVSQSKEVA